MPSTGRSSKLGSSGWAVELDWPALGSDDGEEPVFVGVGERSGVRVECCRELFVGRAFGLDVRRGATRMQVAGALGGAHSTVDFALDDHSKLSLRDGLTALEATRSASRGAIGMRQRRRLLRIGVDEARIDLVAPWNLTFVGCQRFTELVGMLAGGAEEVMPEKGR